MLSRRFMLGTDDVKLEIANKTKATLWDHVAQADQVEDKEEAIVWIRNIHDTCIAFTAMLAYVTLEDDGVCEAVREKIIQLSKQFKIHPREYGEDFFNLTKDPWEFEGINTVIDDYFMDNKIRLRNLGIQILKEQNPATETDFFSIVDSTLDDERERALAKFLYFVYREVAYKRSLIPENTYNAFIQFIQATPIEMLLTL